jgi:hypothetical protein
VKAALDRVFVRARSVCDRLEVLKERSGRGPAYVVVALPDGRPRAVRIASTDLAETPITSRPNAADLPRISARTLIPLMQHLSASLSLLDEKVIRDDPPTASSRVAYRPLPTLAIHPSGRPTADIPRLWPNLSTATQTQIAQILATLLRRMQAVPGTPGRGLGRADQLDRR